MPWKDNWNISEPWHNWVWVPTVSTWCGIYHIAPPSTPRQLKDACGNSRIYIRPLQNDIQLEEMSSELNEVEDDVNLPTCTYSYSSLVYAQLKTNSYTIYCTFDWCRYCMSLYSDCCSINILGSRLSNDKVSKMWHLCGHEPDEASPKHRSWKPIDKGKRLSCIVVRIDFKQFESLFCDDLFSAELFITLWYLNSRQMIHYVYMSTCIYGVN